jgi:hypothetical protein
MAHQDGDDYTWQEPVQPGPVFNPAGPAAPGSEGAWADYWDRQGQRTLGAVLAAAGPDLRTADQREQDDVAGLRVELERLRELVQLTTAPVDIALRIDTVIDALQALTWRVEALERRLGAR